ncbi:DUF6011 domain-containing protein [Streptomyces sp. NPDC058442]|uniref:DUF6011 domain-containing protein n=1 Tax=Streptomyces sp. NPDC058442 TaxID=3346503 RepID=UPI00364A0DA2
MTAPPDTRPSGDPQETPVHCVCGRLLRDAKSKRLRLGPVCRKRLAGRPARRPGTRIAGPHPRAVPLRPAQLEFVWDDQDDDAEPAPHITDVPTGALL